MKIVAVFSFPLDLELTCFATLFKLVKRGHQVYVVVVGNNITSWTGKYKRLLYESCRKIGIDCILFTDRFDYSSVSQDNALVLNSMIREINPEVVFIPFWKSYSRVHNILSKTSLIACRGIGNILMYEFNKNAKFEANIHVTLSELDISTKLDCLLGYWPLLRRHFNRSKPTFMRKTSFLEKSHEVVLTEGNIKSEISSFLLQKVLSVHNFNKIRHENANAKRRWAHFNGASITNQRAVRFTTIPQTSELWESFESHRVLLV